MSVITTGAFRPNRQRRTMTWYERMVTWAFTKLFYNCWRKGERRGTSPATLSLHWFGHQMIKCPTDLWVYQEIVTEMRPDWIVECGTFRGGTSLYLASLLDLLGHGQLVSVDYEHYEGRPQHDRIEYLLGSSTAPAIFRQVKERVAGGRCLVILDSDHSKDHVLEELQLYSELVHPGDYLIVEDSCVNGNPVFRRHGPGPMEAIHEFLKTNDCFTPDPEMERFLLTHNPSGYLKRSA